MKKNLLKKLSLGILFLGIVYITACKKDGVTIQYGASVNSVDALTALSIYDAIWLGGSQSYTMGVLFKSSKNGRITHLGARLAKGTYTVALWDSSSQSVIKSTLVTITDSTQYSFVDIDDVSITANKIYAITVNNTPNGTSEHRLYWVLNVTSSPADNYPHTLGDITFTSEIEKTTSDPLSLFPASYMAPDYIIGFPAFKFEPQL